MVEGHYTPRHLRRIYFKDETIDQLHLSDRIFQHILPEPIRIAPHPRTMRKAREQIKQMVHDGFSIQSIRRYLHRFVLWWVNTSDIWTYNELLILYQETCWDKRLATFALDLLKQRAVKKSHTTTVM